MLQPYALKVCARNVETELGPIDLAFLGAGMYVPFDVRNIDLDGFHKTMALNVDGVINGVAAVLPPMLQRKSGHIAIMGSLFGYAGWLLVQPPLEADFTVGAGVGLLAVAYLLLFLRLIQFICAQNGLFSAHFGWSEQARATLDAGAHKALIDDLAAQL